MELRADSSVAVICPHCTASTRRVRNENDPAGLRFVVVACLGCLHSVDDAFADAAMFGLAGRRLGPPDIGQWPR